MAKVKTDFTKAQKKIDEFKRKGVVILAGSAKKTIVTDTIEKGISPVKGEGRFTRYSESYRKDIKAGRYENKRVSPVNLKLSGDLLKSFFTIKQQSSIIVGFDNPLAVIHTNKGAGKSKVIRKMLPQDNEKFTPSITLRFRELLKRLAKQIFK